MSWFNLPMTNRDIDFANYTRMVTGSTYDRELYTFDKFRKRKRTPIPQDKKSAVYERSSRLCEVCYQSDLDDIHHQDHNPSNHNLDNLLGVCRQCHNRIRRKHKIKVLYDVSMNT